jgi:hypothetical protein
MDKEENGTDLPPEIEVQTASHSCLGLKGWVLILSGVLLLLGALGTFAVAFVVVKRCTYTCETLCTCGMTANYRNLFPLAATMKLDESIISATNLAMWATVVLVVIFG